MSWILDYLKPSDKLVLYDRSNDYTAFTWVRNFKEYIVENKGSDIYDKLTWIIDNYENLPNIALLLKCNIFDYIRPKEFELVKDNQTFTPLLSQFHKETMCDQGMCEQFGVESKPFSYYEDGMYYELNYPSYLKNNPTKNQPDTLTLEWYWKLELPKLLGIDQLEYIPFAPGSNYIIPKENILKHPKELYEQLRSYIDWDVYPGECMIVERGLYTLFKD